MNMRIQKDEFENTVDQYSDIMLRCAYAYCGNYDDAEDIVQEAFIKFLDRSPQFKDDQHKKAWLLRVVINLAKNRNKTFWNRNKTALDEKMPDDNDMLRKCEIWGAVNSLPPKYRIMIFLYYHEQYTIEEAAAMIGISKSTAADRLKKARSLLKKIYEEDNQL